MPVYGIGSLHGPHTLAPTHVVRPRQTSGLGLVGNPSEPVSYMGQVLDRVNQLPEIRQDRVAQLKKAIARGDYDNGDRLDRAVERMLEEMC